MKPKNQESISRNGRKKSFFAYALMLLLVLALVFSIAACSQRPDDSGSGGGGEIKPDANKEQVVNVENLSAREYIKTSVKNLGATYAADPKWLNIDFGITFSFNTYAKVDEKYTDDTVTAVDYNIVVKAAINLEDNAQSALFVEVTDIRSDKVKAGFYYYDATTYVDIGGKKYYAEQLNLSQLGGALLKVLKDKELDIVPLVGNLLGASLNMKGAEQIAGLLPTIWTILFSGDANIVYSAEKDGDMPKYQYINQYLNANTIFDMIMKKKIEIKPFFALDLTWEGIAGLLGMDLPNLDPLLRAFLGFGLEDIVNKKWPSMTVEIKAITELADVKQADNTTKKDYKFTGLAIDVQSATKEYDLNLTINPFKLNTSDSDEVKMNLAGYNFGASGKNSTYEKASFTNLELNLNLGVDAEKDEELTIDSLLGGFLDLGAVGSIPLRISGNSHYDFDVKIAASLDLFNNANNKAQATIKYCGAEVISLYLVPDLSLQEGSSVMFNTLYIDASNLTSNGKALMPQLRLPSLNITQILAGTPEVPGLLGKIMKYFDPYYAGTTSGTRPSNADEEEKGGLDVMKLLQLLLQTDEQGNLKCFTFPNDESKVFGLKFDNAGINTLLGMFKPGLSLGVYGVGLSLDLADIFNSIRLKLDVTEDMNVHVGFGKTNQDGTYTTGISYFKAPVFDMDAVGCDSNGDVPSDGVEKAEALRGEYRSMAGALEYGATITGDFKIGSNADTEIDLSAIVGAFVKNVLVGLGIETGSELHIGYEIKAGVNLLRLSELGLIIDLYLLDDEGKKVYGFPFLTLYYSGTDDTLYINPRVDEEADMVTQLHDKLGFTKIIDGKIPKLSIPDIGLAKILGKIKFDFSKIGSIIGANADLNLSLNADGTVEFGKGLDEEDMQKTLLHMLADTVVLNADGNGSTGGSSLDIMGLIGKAIEEISVKDGRLGVVVNAEVLSAVVALTSLDITGDLPKVNGNLFLHLGTQIAYDANDNQLYEYTYYNAEGVKEKKVFSYRYNEDGRLFIYDENGNLEYRYEQDSSALRGQKLSHRLYRNSGQRHGQERRFVRRT